MSKCRVGFTLDGAEANYVIDIGDEPYSVELAIYLGERCLEQEGHDALAWEWTYSEALPS